MARVTAVNKPGDYPGNPDAATRRELDTLFNALFPGVPDPEIDPSHAGIAIAAQNPALALHLARLSAFIATELTWCQCTALRELAIQTVNVHFGCDYSFQARVPVAAAAGLGTDAQAALPAWQSSEHFDEEQKLVIEYTHAVAAGAVPDELFSRGVARYGEKGTIELTSLVAFWSFWAMFLNATRPGPGLSDGPGSHSASGA